MNAGASPIPSSELHSPRGFDFGMLIDLFARRWPLMASIVVFVTVAIVAVSLLVTPQYNANVRLKINPLQRIDVSTARDAVEQPDQSVVDTEVSIMRSRDIAVGVSKRLKLSSDAGFTKGLEKERNLDDAIVSKLVANVIVTREPSTYIVDIAYRDSDANRAARIANAFSEEYLDSSVERRTGTAARQAKWLDGRLAALGGDVQSADAAVARYRAQAGIVEGGTNGTITDQQVAPLSSQLATAEAEAAAARSKLDAARGQIARGGLDAVSSVLSSATITELRSQRGEVLRELAQINARYGPRHPESIRVANQLAGIDKALQDEARRIVGGLESEARAASASAGSLRADLSRLRGQQAGDTRAAVTAASLERQAEAKRTVYNQLAQQAQQTNQQERSSEPQGTVIERATVPARPSSPNKVLYALLGVVLGSVLGFLAALLIELLSTGIRTVDDVERGLGVPFLTSLPLLSTRRLKRDGMADMSPPEYIAARPMSTYAEALRTIRTSAILAMHPRPRVISIVSAVPGEGKSSTAAALSRVMALSGDRVVLVDCDLRRGSLTAMTQAPPVVGLIEVLSGEATIDAAIVHDSVEGLDILPLNKPSFTPKDLFSGDAMRALVSQLSERYDYVVLDTPPLLAVADARILAGMSDTTVMVVHWQYTPRRAVRAALSLFEQDGTPLSGIVLSMASAKAKSVGADNPAYYYSMYRQYHEA